MLFNLNCKFLNQRFTNLFKSFYFCGMKNENENEQIKITYKKEGEEEKDESFIYLRIDIYFL